MDNTFQSFIDEILNFINAGEYASAKIQVLYTLNKLNKDNKMYPYYLGEIAGFLIDIGNESIDIELVKKGVEILEKEEGLLKDYVTEQSYYYNIANGKSALFRLNNLNDKYPELGAIGSDLTDAKNYYYKAYKFIDLRNLKNLDLQVITNLGIVLNKSGRSIEAIDLYTKVLKENKDFVEALISYSEALDYWIRTSCCSQPIALICRIYSSLAEANKSNKVSLYFKETLVQRLKYYKDILISYNYDLNSLKEDLELSEEEYSTHNTFRKFSISNYLTLNEHAVFCGCLAATFDTLSIGSESIQVIGENALKMELLLNRIKSEFHMSRKLYLENIHLEDSMSEVIYSDLDDNEQIGEASEKLRISFRLCFGILDKIAYGICYFLDVKNSNTEKVYFESFWKNPQRMDRWEILKNIKNPHLVALYSIANDLNSRSGEFGFLKKWRNLLEHNNLILKEDEYIDNTTSLFNDEDFVTVISYKYFRVQTIYLLQLCRSAIFCFTYFIRTEGLLNEGEKEVRELKI